jgi:nucleotide-binding universal stress UspA family protein
MLNLKTILYPTDFSRASETAFRLACSLARDYGARLVVLHVHVPLMSMGEAINHPEPENYKEELWNEFRRLEASEPKITDLRVDTKLCEGDPAREILRLAAEIKPELIVMGTHGRTGLARLLMGSVAEEVVRRSSYPVLTVKAPLPLLRPIKKSAPEAGNKTGEPTHGMEFNPFLEALNSRAK